MAASSSPIRFPSRVGFAWLGTVMLGWPLVAFAIYEGISVPRLAAVPALLTTSAMVIVLECLPVRVNLRHYAANIVISDAFVYALMFIWGPWPAIVVRTVGSIATDLHAGRPWYKVTFNPALYALATFGTSIVVAHFRGAVSLDQPLGELRTEDLGWVALSWLVWLVINQSLVAGVVTGLIGYVTSSPRDFIQDMLLNLGVLAMSPLVVAIAISHASLVPTMLIPLLLLRWTGQVAIDQEREAARDTLTGLPNRLSLRRRLDAATSARSPSEPAFAVMLLDLNDFKAVNDTLGHPAGDALLIEVADRLRRTIRPDDLVARLGGDEFAILAPGVDASSVGAVMHNIQGCFAEPVLVDSTQLVVRCSVGVALYPQHGTEPTELLRFADIAMYRAKNLGTGIELYQPDRDEEPFRRPVVNHDTPLPAAS